MPTNEIMVNGIRLFEVADSKMPKVMKALSTNGRELPQLIIVDGENCTWDGQIFRCDGEAKLYHREEEAKAEADRAHASTPVTEVAVVTKDMSDTIYQIT